MASTVSMFIAGALMFIAGFMFVAKLCDWLDERRTRKVEEKPPPS